MPHVLYTKYHFCYQVSKGEFAGKPVAIKVRLIICRHISHKSRAVPQLETPDTLVSSATAVRAVRPDGNGVAPGEVVAFVRSTHLVAQTFLAFTLTRALIVVGRSVLPVQHPPPKYRTLLRHEHRRFPETWCLLLPSV